MVLYRKGIRFDIKETFFRAESEKDISWECVFCNNFHTCDVPIRIRKIIVSCSDYNPETTQTDSNPYPIGFIQEYFNQPSSAHFVWSTD